jgi:hypothetical protein
MDRHKPPKDGPPQRLLVRFGFLEADDALAVFELTAFFEHLDALETLQNIALRLDRALTAETSVLTHNAMENNGTPLRGQTKAAGSAQPSQGTGSDRQPEKRGAKKNSPPDRRAGQLPPLRFRCRAAHGSSSSLLKCPRTKR